MSVIVAIVTLVGIVLATSLVAGVVSYLYSLVDINREVASQINLQNQYDVHRYNYNISVFSRNAQPRGVPPPAPPRPPTPGPAKLSPDGKVVVVMRRPAPPKDPRKK